MSEATPTPAALPDGEPTDVTAVLAQLRETIGNLDALLASVHDAPETPPAE